jgi:YD repeat-containing protein
VAAAARQDRAQWAYTPRNLLDRYTPPLLGSTSTPTTYTADKDRNTTSIVQPGGITVDFTYDADGKLVRMSQPRGTTRLGYSTATGLLATATSPDGEKLEYAYDGSLPAKTTFTGTVNGEVSSTYDADLRLTSDSAAGASASYAYDDDGMLIRAGTLALTRNADNGLLTGMSGGALFAFGSGMFGVGRSG